MKSVTYSKLFLLAVCIVVLVLLGNECQGGDIQVTYPTAEYTLQSLEDSNIHPGNPTPSFCLVNCKESEE